LDMVHSLHHEPFSKPEQNWINCLLFSRWMSAKHQQRTRELQFASSQRHAAFPLVSERELDIFLFWEAESSSRAGFILITGLTLGASHESMADAMEIIAASKHSRSLYAEAAQDKRLLYNTLRSSLWNAKMDPLVVVFRVAPVQEHDFRRGPYAALMTIFLKNYSPTHNLKFVLSLSTADADISDTPSSNASVPPFIGLTRRHGALQPLTVGQENVKVCICQPGTYATGGWSLETYVHSSIDNGQTRAQRFVRTWSSQPSAIFTVIHSTN